MANDIQNKIFIAVKKKKDVYVLLFFEPLNSVQNYEMFSSQ